MCSVYGGSFAVAGRVCNFVANALRTMHTCLYLWCRVLCFEYALFRYTFSDSAFGTPIRSQPCDELNYTQHTTDIYRWHNMNLWPLSSLSRLLSLHLAPAFADSLYLSLCFSLPSLCHSPSFQPVVQVFPQYELLGWYSTGDEATAVDLDIHRKVRQAQAHITWALRYNQRAARPSSTSLYSVLRLSCVSRVVILVADKRATPQAAPALRPVRFLGCSCFFRRTDVGAFLISCTCHHT